MHELSIAMNIVEIADEESKKAGATKVCEIELEIGTMAGIVIDALEFALDEAKKNSVISDAKITINNIPAKARCLDCDHEFDVEELFTPCPKCNSFRNDIIQGKELRVKRLIAQ